VVICVLFGSPFDEAKYQRIIDACALAPDLKRLEGDEGGREGGREGEREGEREGGKRRW